MKYNSFESRKAARKKIEEIYPQMKKIDADEIQMELLMFRIILHPEHLRINLFNSLHPRRSVSSDRFALLSSS